MPVRFAQIETQVTEGLRGNRDSETRKLPVATHAAEFERRALWVAADRPDDLDKIVLRRTMKDRPSLQDSCRLRQSYQGALEGLVNQRDFL